MPTPCHSSGAAGEGARHRVLLLARLVFASALAAGGTFLPAETTLLHRVRPLLRVVGSVSLAWLLSDRRRDGGCRPVMFGCGQLVCGAVLLAQLRAPRACQPRTPRDAAGRHRRPRVKREEGASQSLACASRQLAACTTVYTAGLKLW